MNIFYTYLEVITCELLKENQFKVLHAKIKDIKDVYFNIFNKYPNYKNTTKYIEYRYILKLFILYYYFINEDNKLSIIDNLLSEEPLSDREFFKELCYIYQTYRGYIVYEIKDDRLLTDTIKSIYLPGIVKIKIRDIVDGIIDNYSFIYFEDKYTTYIPHNNNLSVSYFQHDIDHQMGTIITINNNPEKYLKLKDIWILYKNKLGMFDCRIFEIMIFMRYHEMLSKFNGIDFLTNSIFFDDDDVDTEDITNLIKYILNSYDINENFKIYMLERLYDIEIDEESLTDKERLQILSQDLISHLQDTNNELYNLLIELF